MLNVSYLKTYGYIKMYNVTGRDFKCDIHPANCLYATIWHNRKEHTAHLVDFFMDEKHLERCLKDKIFDNYTEIVIYTNTDWNEKYKVAKLWAKYGFKVTLKVAKKWRKHEKKKTISK